MHAALAPVPTTTGRKACVYRTYTPNFCMYVGLQDAETPKATKGVCPVQLNGTACMGKLLT
jgi:hypothetical protein